MRTKDASSPTAVALELELELRRSGEQLRDSDARRQEAERQAAAAETSARRTHGLLEAVHSVGTGSLGLAAVLGPLGKAAPTEQTLPAASKAWELLGHLTGLTAAEAHEAEQRAELLRARGRAIAGDETALDRELDALRTALTRIRVI